MPPKKRKSPFAGFKSLLLSYNTFTINERKGIFMLMVIMVLLLAVFLFLKYAPVQMPAADYTRLNNAVAAYQTMYKVPAAAFAAKDTSAFTSHPAASSYNSPPNTIAPEQKPAVKLFSFNPNHLADSAWLALGLSQKQIRVINNYQNKGGKFYSKADVKKMYCISDKQYAVLEPYINLPDVRSAFARDSFPKTNSKTFEPKAEIKITPVELNIANEEDLITIPGVGPARASAIIKYRDKLGGYMELEQVKEAYGMDSVFDRIKKYLQLELYTTRFININASNAADLKHPYLTQTLVYIIMNYRKEHGNFTKVEDLKKLNILDEITYKKLEPYLKAR